MSWDTEKIKPASRKIYLFELDWPLTADTFFTAQAGIWQVPLSPNYGTDGSVSLTLDDGYVMYYEDTGRNETLRIGSLIVDSEQYSAQTSIAACITQNESYYYNPENYVLYIHFDGFGVPWGKVVNIGIILAFSNMPDVNNNIYYDGIPYDTRLISVPSLSKKRDNLFYGILQYAGGSVSLNNYDGYFETLINDINIFGQPVRLYSGFDGFDFSDFRQVHEGYVDDYSYTREEFNINIADAKKFLTRKIPINTFNTSDYPNLKSENSGKVKPVAWGSIRNAPLTCVNELSTAPSTYSFFVVDTEFNDLLSVSDVYVNSKALSTGDWSYSTTGFVYISSDATVVDTGGSTWPITSYLAMITADFVSASTEMLGLNVLTDMLNNYEAISTNALVNNYDSTQWLLSLADSREVGVYVKTEIEINDIITKICVAEDGVMLVLDDGRFTFIKDSTTYTLDRTIEVDEWISDPEIDYPRDEYLTSIKIKYDANQFSNTYRSYINNDYESTSYGKYRTYKQIEQETVLTSTTDVETKAELMMIHSKDIIPTIVRKTKIQNSDLEIGDIILATHDRLSESTKVWRKYKLIGKENDLNNSEVTLTQRWVSDSTS